LIRYRPPLGVICWLTGARPDEVGRVDLRVRAHAREDFPRGFRLRA